MRGVANASTFHQSRDNTSIDLNLHMSTISITVANMLSYKTSVNAVNCNFQGKQTAFHCFIRYNMNVQRKDFDINISTVHARNH